MYGPLEEKSGSLYRSRKIVEYKTEDGTVTDTVRWVEQTPRWDDIEEGHERAKALADGTKDEKKKKEVTDMTDEKDEPAATEDGGMEDVEDKTTAQKRSSSYESVRSLDKEAHFLICEFITHARYLLDFTFMSEEEIKFYKYWMGLKADNY
jgi:hypothetical protein